MPFIRCTSDNCKSCRDRAEFLGIEYEQMDKFDPFIPRSEYYLKK